MDGRKAVGMKFKINISTPDNGERFVVEMSNATLATIVGYQTKDADLTITINRRELEDVMIGTAKLADKHDGRQSAGAYAAWLDNGQVRQLVRGFARH